jgi:Family of unknown function (DUF6159)
LPLAARPVIAFSNVALLTGIARRIDGRRFRPKAGLLRACRRIRWIAVYALVSATVGLVDYWIRLVFDPIFGAVIAPTIGRELSERRQRISYSVPLLMAIPVIALDLPPSKHPFQRSEALVMSTWGECAKPAHGTGTLPVLVLIATTALLTLPVVRQGLVAHDPVWVRIGLTATLMATSTYVQIHALVDAVFALAAYRYATTGRDDLFSADPRFGEHAFLRSHPRGKTQRLAMTE